MTKWDNLHERFFNHLALLSFDKAKELLEKDGNKTNSDFVQYLNLLVQYERTYHNFGFVAGARNNSGSGKRDKSLAVCYSDLHMSMLKEQSANKRNSTNEPIEDETKGMVIQLQQLMAGLSTFLDIRTHLMKLYDQISSAVKQNERNVCLENYLNEVTTITDVDMSALNIPVLSSMRRLLKHEIDCLSLLFHAHMFICEYHYMDAVSTLHNMHCILKEWNDSIENQPTNNNRFLLSNSSPLNFFKTQTKPALFTFFFKFHELLVAKFTLYFADKLLAYGGPDAKTSMAKANPDFIARISHFHRRSNVEWITLVLHTIAEPQCDTKVQSVDNGTVQHSNFPANSIDEKPFQIIFGFPNKPHPTDEAAQQILSKVSINNEILVNGEKVSYFGDTNQTKTFFLQNIDPRITLVLVFASHRQERDTTITSFISELIELLRGTRQLVHFKNAPK